MEHKEESRKTMEEISPNEEAGVTNERSATFYLYHPCSLLQKFLGTFFKCLGFEIETNEKEHDEVEAHSDAEEDLGSNDDGKVLACEEQKECSTSDGQSFVSFSLFLIFLTEFFLFNLR